MSLLSENIRKMRKELRLLQSEMAEELAKSQKINVSQRQVSYWETGTLEPDIDTLIALAKFFSTSVDELHGVDGY